MRDVLLETAIRTAEDHPASVLNYFADNGDEAACGLTMAMADGRTVIVLTEIPWNPGPSITFTAPRIATVVLARHPEIREERVTWIEHRCGWERKDDASGRRYSVDPKARHAYCEMLGLPEGPVQWAPL